MARRRKKQEQGVVTLTHEEWLALWSQRVNYTPPPAIKRGQGVRRVEGVPCDPTLFTSMGPSKRTLRKRASHRKSY